MRQIAGDRLGEMTRQQLAMTAEAIATNFRFAASWRKSQMEMFQRAGLLYSRAAEDLRESANGAEVNSILMVLPTAVLQEALRNYQEMMMTGTRGFADSIDPPHVQAGKVESAQAQAAPTDVAGPVWQAWQAYLTRTLNEMQH